MTTTIGGVQHDDDVVRVSAHDLFPPRHALPVTAGCEARGKAQGSVSHPTEYRRGEGRTGERVKPSTDVSLVLAPGMGRCSGVQGLAVGRRHAAVGESHWPCGHRSPRDIEGTLPGRISCVRNVETLLGSGPGAGKPTVREAQFPSGKG